MKHPSIRELYDYWNARRRHRAAPTRDDIDPGDIRGALADTFIINFDKPAGHPFRIAGTRVCALFGRDLKHEAFLDLWSPQSRAIVCDLIGIVAGESIGLLAGITAAGESGDLDLELLALPLRHERRTDARVLGALAPGRIPAWSGDSALGSLALGTFRYVGPAAISNVPSPPGPSDPKGRRRHGLVVYEGGLSRNDVAMPPTA